ncbi:DUF2164 domain-containing protein [Roseibium aestuarii]|uniref:DUF2164 domain-containing protein n=1 Tax=Roseibium aestuarii TaxID=2600299 RepID=A0ABW4JYV1_9HYPH|nr:DUF2164 family protein [Roseibium aestuarii]
MADDLLSPQEQDALAREIQTWVRDELETEIGNMQALMLLDRLNDTLGAAHYNRGLRDAAAAASRRNDDLVDDLHALERPWSGRR